VVLAAVLDFDLQDLLAILLQYHQLATVLLHRDAELRATGFLPAFPQAWCYAKLPLGFLPAFTHAWRFAKLRPLVGFLPLLPLFEREARDLRLN